MSLADNLAGQGVGGETAWDGESGTIKTRPIVPVEDFGELLVQFGYDPDKVEISGKVNQWRKETRDGTFLVSYFFGIRSKERDVDLPLLYERIAASEKLIPALLPPSTDNTFADVVVVADVQMGKVGSRGGTLELLARLAQKRSALKERWDTNRPGIIFIPDLGDAVESVENVPLQQLNTNDLSFPKQVDAYAVEIFEFIKLAAQYAPVVVAPVPSNHGAWRNGKQNLGIPDDDWGLHIHRQVEKRIADLGWDVTWVYPLPHDESVAVDILGTRVGLVHGNQFGPGRGVQWWESQIHGAQPVAGCDILLSGHYHYLSILPTGRSLKTGKPKWWVQAPTLDNGSDWYRNKAGSDSDPGLLVYSITEDGGFDLQSLAVL